MPDRYVQLASYAAAATGGTPVERPHVTIAYLAGGAAPTGVVERIQQVSGLNVPIHARGWSSFRATPHPLFGYTLFLRVKKNDVLGYWHHTVAAALRPLDLSLSQTWPESRPHLRVVEQMSLTPQAAIWRLEPQSATFTATHLTVTQLTGGRFRAWLHRPLGGTAESGQSSASCDGRR